MKSLIMLNHLRNPRKSWDEVPEEIKQTFDKLGIPEAEQKYLAGVSAQYESEVVYHNMKEDLEDLGIVFKDTDSALEKMKIFSVNIWESHSHLQIINLLH